MSLTVDDLVVRVTARGGGSGDGAGNPPAPADAPPPTAPSTTTNDAARLVAGGLESVLHRLRVTATRVAVRVELPPSPGAASPAPDGVALLLRASEVAVAGDAPARGDAGGVIVLAKRVSVAGVTLEVVARRRRSRREEGDDDGGASTDDDDTTTSPPITIIGGARGARGAAATVRVALTWRTPSDGGPPPPPSLDAELSLDPISIRLEARSLALLAAAAAAWPAPEARRPAPPRSPPQRASSTFYDAESGATASAASLASFMSCAASAVSCERSDGGEDGTTLDPAWCVRLSVAAAECVLFYEDGHTPRPSIGIGGRPRLALAIGAADGRASGAGGSDFDARLAVYDVRASDVARRATGKADSKAAAARRAPGTLPALAGGVARPAHASCARRGRRGASGAAATTVAGLAAVPTDGGNAGVTPDSDSDSDTALDEWPLLAVAGGRRGGAPALELRASAARRGGVTAAAHARAATLWLSLPLLERVACVLAAAGGREGGDGVVAPAAATPPSSSRALALSVYLPHVTTVLLLPVEDEGDTPPSSSTLALALDLSAPPPSAPGAPSVPTLAAAAGERGGWDARLRVGAAGAYIVEAAGDREPVLTARRFADARPPSGPDAALSPCPDAATADVAWRPGAAPAPGSLGDGAWAAVRAHAAAAAAAVDTAAPPPPPPPPFETDARALAGLLLRIVAADVRLALAPADVAVLSSAAGAVAAAQAKAVAAAAAAAAAAGAPPPPPPPVAALDIHASLLLHFMEAGVAEPAFTARAGRVAAFIAAPLGDGGAAAAVAIASSQLRERDGGVDLVAWPVGPSPTGRARGGASPWWAAGDGDSDTAAVRVFAASRPSDAGPHSIVSVAAASATLTAVGGDVGLPWARRVAAVVSGGGGGNDHPRSPPPPPPPPHPIEWYVTASQCALRVEPASGGVPAAAAAAALTCGAAVARGGPTPNDAASLALHDVALLLADVNAPGRRDAWRPHATADASLASALAAAGHTLVLSQRALAVTTHVDAAPSTTRHVRVTGARVRGTVGAAACRLVRAVPRSERDGAAYPPPQPPATTPTPSHPLAGIVDDALAPRQPSTPRSPRHSTDEWHAIDAAPSPPSPPPDEGRGVWLDSDGGHLRPRNGVAVVDDFVRVGGGEGGSGSARPQDAAPHTLPLPSHPPALVLSIATDGALIVLDCPRGGASGGGRALEVEVGAVDVTARVWQSGGGASTTPTLLTRTCVTIADATLRDSGADDPDWRVVVGRRTPVTRGDDSLPPLLRVDVDTLLPRSNASPEARASISSLPPLRVRLDQDVAGALASLADAPGPGLAFGEGDLVLDDDDDEQEEEEEEDAGGDAPDAPLPPPPPSTPPHTFIQRLALGRVDLLLDYRPRRVDVRALAAGRLSELVNAAPLDGVRVTLPPLVVRGVSGGVPAAASRALAAWTHALRSRGLRPLLDGFPAARAVARVAHPAGDVLRLPADAVRAAVRADGRATATATGRRAQRSLTRLVRAALAEALGATSSALGGVRVLVEGDTGVRRAVGAAVGAVGGVAARGAAGLRE